MYVCMYVCLIIFLLIILLLNCILLLYFIYIVQITLNEEFALLASAVITAYVTYLCNASVTLSPNTQCNPTIYSSYQTVQAGIGMGTCIMYQ